jgi:hypothetical protein
VAIGAGLAVFLLLGLAFLAAGLSGVAPMDLPGFPAAGGHASPTGTPLRSTRTPEPQLSGSGGATVTAGTSQAPGTTPAPTTATSTKPGRRPSTAPTHSPHPTRTR